MRKKLTEIHKALKQSIIMLKWRKNIVERDNFKCCICNDDKKELHVHHIKDFKNNIDLALDDDNAITLCINCHQATYGKELLFEKLLFEMIENGANSVNTLPSNVGGNAEPNSSSNGEKCVSHRERVRIELLKLIEKSQGGIVNCKICSKEIKKRYCELTRSGRNNNYFCSRKCKGIHHSNIFTGSNHPRYKQRIIMICLYCNKVMKPTPSKPTNIKKYCDNICQSKFRKDSNFPHEDPTRKG